MAKRSSKAGKKNRKQTEAEANAATSERMERATGATNEELQGHLVDQLVKSLWLPSGASEENKKNCVLAAFAALQGIKPRDEIEGMLGVQMVATHSAAMECLRRAMIEDQTIVGRDQNLKHGAKLLTLYARQLEVLDKHRGKGQQKMTIEYVNVEAGGRAIVGQVHTDKAPQGEDNATDSSPKALTHNPGDTIDMETEEAPQKVKRKTRKTRR